MMTATFFRSTCCSCYLNSPMAARYSSFAIGVGLCSFTLSMGCWPNRDVDLGRYSFLFVNETRLRAMDIESSGSADLYGLPTSVTL